MKFVLTLIIFMGVSAQAKVEPEDPINSSQLRAWPKGTVIMFVNEARQFTSHRLESVSKDEYKWSTQGPCSFTESKTDPFMPRLKWSDCKTWFAEISSGEIELTNYKSPWPIKKDDEWEYKVKIKRKVTPLVKAKDVDTGYVLGKVKSEEEDLSVKCKSGGFQSVGTIEGSKTLHQVTCSLGYETTKYLFDPEIGTVYYKESSYRGSPSSIKEWYYDAKFPLPRLKTQVTPKPKAARSEAKLDKSEAKTAKSE